MRVIIECDDLQTHVKYAEGELGMSQFYFSKRALQVSWADVTTNQLYSGYTDTYSATLGSWLHEM